MKKRILLLGTLGMAAGVLYLLESRLRKQNGNADGDSATARRHSSTSDGATRRGSLVARIENAKARLSTNEAQRAIDDQGTNQLAASQILKNIRDKAFDASDEKLALALGRPTEEIEQWTSGNGMIDGDVIMKARALAMQRGLESE